MKDSRSDLSSEATMYAIVFLLVAISLSIRDISGLMKEHQGCPACCVAKEQP